MTEYYPIYVSQDAALGVVRSVYPLAASLAIREAFFADDVVIKGGWKRIASHAWDDQDLYHLRLGGAKAVALEIRDADGMRIAALSDWTLEELAEGVPSPV